MDSFFPLMCPQHHSPLDLVPDRTAYGCHSGCRFEILNHIPRFVSMENYASSFGLQWNAYRQTQLDSYTGVPISKERLMRIVGGDLEIFRGKNVLEAGCGAGRFTEILLESGAHVWAVDISTAVEANYNNCCKYSNYFIAQANILELPFAPGQFDIVVCIGVIQHTPDPEMTMQRLCEQVKPGGLLVIDHYTYGYASTLSRRMLRALLLKTSNKFSLKFCQTLTYLLWPLHRLFWKVQTLPFARRLRNFFVKLSPLVDYHDAYPQLGPKLLKIWAALDTHDTLTDYYKHLRSVEEIRTHLHKCGMVGIETNYAGNGVEARARKPGTSHVSATGQDACKKVAEDISMIQKKPNFLKQVVLCAWIGFTVFVWLTLNTPIPRVVPSIISKFMAKTRELVWPYVYRQYIFTEKDSKEGK